MGTTPLAPNLRQRHSGSDERRRQLDEIASALPRRAGALSRLVLARSGAQMSRTEVSVLQSLEARPWRITELAAAEGVTQPAITLIVNKLEGRGLVARETDPSDGRAVLVSLTESGLVQFEALRSQYRALIGLQLANLPDEDVATLARAAEILDGVIERLKES